MQALAFWQYPTCCYIACSMSWTFWPLDKNLCEPGSIVCHRINSQRTLPILSKVGKARGKKANHNKIFSNLFRVPSIRIMLGTFILSSSVIILGYSGTLTSFLTIRLPPKHLERVSGFFAVIVKICCCFILLLKRPGDI